MRAEWHLDTPMGNSVEEGDPGLLSTDYCVPGSSRVRLLGDTIAVMRRPYYGDTVEVVTASGKKLAATPNHPVLTTRGWVEAGTLGEGDHVISDSLQNLTRFGPNDDKHVVAEIEQVFDLAARLYFGPRVAKPLNQFDANGVNESVDVVPIDSLLRDRLHAALGKPLSNLGLPSANAAHEWLHSRSVAATLTVAGSLPGSPSVERGQLRSPRLRRQRIPVTLGATAHRIQALGGGHPGGSGLHTGGVALAELRPGSTQRRGGALVSSLDAPSAEFFADREWVNDEALAEIAQAFPGEVTSDEIIRIRRNPFSGHVYNLETRSHWFAAEGIITHNCVNVDTRFRGTVGLGPLVTTINLAQTGETAANANGMAFTRTMSATREYAEVIRGTKTGKIRLDTRANIADSSMTAFAERARHILYSKSSAGDEEIAVGFDNIAYRVATTIGDTGGDTFAENADAVFNRIHGIAGSDNAAGQVAGFGRSGSTGTAMVTARQNILTGAVTMTDGSWVTRATLSGEAVAFTGFAMDGDFWLVGTDRGVIYLDSNFQRFRLLQTSLNVDLVNCHGMGSIDFLGPAVVVPLQRSLRMIQSLQSRSIGLETYRNNLSPVQGLYTGGVTASELWMYVPVKNPYTDDFFICAARPRQQGDPHGNPISYYPIIRIEDKDCEFIEYAGTRGGVTNPTVYFGIDGDAGWFLEGQSNRFPIDGTCTYAASGTWYGTQLRRDPEKGKKPSCFDFTAADCTSTETLTLSITIEDWQGVERTVQVGPPVTKNGFHRLWLREADAVDARRITPSIAFARGGTTTATPRIEGVLGMEFELTEGRDSSGLNYGAEVKRRAIR